MMVPGIVADGLGSSLDETVAELMLFLAVGLGVAGFLRLGKSRRAEGAALIAGALVVVGLAFFVPQRYLRPRIAKIRPATTATLRIEAPASDAVVEGKTLRVVFDLENGRLIDRATTRLRPDEGHIHLSLDGSLVGTSFGLVETLDVAGLKPGVHYLKGEFVAGDHGPFAPRVISEVRFRVQR